MSQATEAVRARVIMALKELEDLFAPGMKLTFIARKPDNSECCLAVTEDDLAAVAYAALYLANKEEEGK